MLQIRSVTHCNRTLGGKRERGESDLENLCAIHTTGVEILR